MLRLLSLILLILIGAPSSAQQAFPFHNKAGQLPGWFSRGGASGPEPQLSFDRAARYAMEHVYFGTSYLRLDPLDFSDYTRDEVAQSYALSARYVLNFLNGALKGDKSGFAYLMKKPEQLGMPRHSVDSQFFAARP